jgi:Xaa-Pro aminopeptidase
MTPARGFSPDEFRARLARAQDRMAAEGFDALLLTTEPEVRYFTGYLTRFWESPSRPWFLVVPASGDPVAVIPSIGAFLMGKTWITDIRTWRAPDLEDDGVTLLADTLRELAGAKGRVAVPMGHETHLRMPLSDFGALARAIAPVTLVPDDGLMRALRMVKSEAEIAKIRHACGIADRAFGRVAEYARAGVALDEVFRRFQITCLQEGADWVPYVAGAAGQGGYGDVISPATGELLRPGDVLMLDTGLIWDGYFCDFDRNFAVGVVDPAAQAALARLADAVAAGLAAAVPGATAAEVFHAMDKIVTGGAGGSDAGRLGHGLGMQLTEWPSLIPGDHTVLAEGMVLTLEPGIEVAPGRILVAEENIVLRAGGAEMLSTPAPRAMPELTGEAE